MIASTRVPANMPGMATIQRLVAVAAWQVASDAGGRTPLDARVLPLLHGIARHATLAAAARACALPYRTAWSILKAAGTALGTPLAELSPGRGAALTALAKQLVAADDEAQRLLANRIAVLDVRTESGRLARGAPPLKLAASHDIALAQLKDRWRSAHQVQLLFQGSAANIAALHAGKADVAGFHVPDAVGGEDLLLARLDPARDALLRFLTRAQGLIVPRGNPRRVRGLGDLVSRQLRIVNRQAGSGTRLLLDRLLAAAGIDGESIAGYTTEEFTHAAVAATVAAGKADAAFGIRAAAAQFGLAFVPLASERYLFACRRRALDSARLVAFRELLRSATTRAVVDPLPGYALDAPGEIEPPPYA